MAGVPGFEPGNGGIKTRCLTAWLYPSRGTDLLKCHSVMERARTESGWGTRIRTWEWRDQNPLPYRLAIPQLTNYSFRFWCGRRDSNSHAVRHWNLNPACLPIPPLPPIKTK